MTMSSRMGDREPANGSRHQDAVPDRTFGAPRCVDVLDEPAAGDGERDERGEAERRHERGANELMIKL